MGVIVNKLKRQIAIKIRDYAAQEGLTQKDVADLTDTTQSRVSLIFNMRLEKITLDSLFKMLQNLSIETTIIFT